MKASWTKRLFIFSLGLLLALSSSAQADEVVILKYKYYTSFFSTSKHIPLMVEYTLTKDMLSCSAKIPRSSEKFSADPDHKDITNLNKDYVRSGYDRGHNMSAADNSCDQDGLKECFYFSNMTPQPHSFNAGRWEDLEKEERTDATQRGEILVSIGSLGEAATIGDDNIVVPKQMWKVIYTPQSNSYECYLFPDEDGVDKPLDDYKTDLPTIQESAGITFANGLATFNDAPVMFANKSMKPLTEKIRINNLTNTTSMKSQIPPSTLLIMILIGAILGAVGQGIRVIIGLKKVYDDALKQQKAVSDIIEYQQLALSLFIGFAVGGVCGVLAVVGSDSVDFSKSQIMLFIASGYAGTDFIEGFIKKYPDVKGTVKDGNNP